MDQKNIDAVPVPVPVPVPTVSPHAALQYYRNLFLDQPVQFIHFYLSRTPFRDAVHASGLCVLFPPEPSASAAPVLALLPPTHPPPTPSPSPTIIDQQPHPHQYPNPNPSPALSDPTTHNTSLPLPPLPSLPLTTPNQHTPSPTSSLSNALQERPTHESAPPHVVEGNSTQAQPQVIDSVLPIGSAHTAPEDAHRTEYLPGPLLADPPPQLTNSATDQNLSPSVQMLFDAVGAAVQKKGHGPPKFGAIGENHSAKRRQQDRQPRRNHSSPSPSSSSPHPAVDQSTFPTKVTIEDPHLRNMPRNPSDRFRSALQHHPSTKRQQHVQNMATATTTTSDDTSARHLNSKLASPIDQLTTQLDSLLVTKNDAKLSEAPARRIVSPAQLVVDHAQERPFPTDPNRYHVKHRLNLPATPRPTRVSRRTLDPLPIRPDPIEVSPDDMTKLNRMALDIFDQIRPESGESHRRARLLAHMNKVVRSEWPNASVRMFGSGANGLNMRSGDVDMCLMVPPQIARQRAAETDEDGRHGKDRRSYREHTGPLTDKQIMRRMAGMLRRSKMTNVQELLRARVPIIKVSDPVSGFRIDLCLNNDLVHHNTDLLRSYVNLDTRVRPLCLLVKHWAKRRGINETYRGTLSSYAYVLLIINFLQLRSPPVLPCLQRMKNGRPVGAQDVNPESLVAAADGKKWNVYFDRSVKSFSGGNCESIGDLLIGFFRFYGFEFDYTRSVVCPRLGKLISRDSKKWDVATVASMIANAEAEADLESALDTDRLMKKKASEQSALNPTSSSNGKCNRVVKEQLLHDLVKHRFPDSEEKAYTSTPTDSQLSSPSVGASRDDNGSSPALFISHRNHFANGHGDHLVQVEDEIELTPDERRDRILKRLMRSVDQHYFCIEDPFEQCHDLGRTVDAETLDVIRQEFVRAYTILAKSARLEDVFEKWAEA